jgi:hypothetical protein
MVPPLTLRRLGQIFIKRKDTRKACGRFEFGGRRCKRHTLCFKSMWIFPKISTDPIAHRPDLSLNNMTTARRQIVLLPVFSPSRIEDSREPIVRIDFSGIASPSTPSVGNHRAGERDGNRIHAPVPCSRAGETPKAADASNATGIRRRGIIPARFSFV